jgi:hypothetical protein
MGQELYLIIGNAASGTMDPITGYGIKKEKRRGISVKETVCWGVDCCLLDGQIHEVIPGERDDKAQDCQLNHKQHEIFHCIR